MVYPTSSWQRTVQRISQPVITCIDIFSISKFNFSCEPYFSFFSTVSCGNEFYTLIMKCMKKEFHLFLLNLPSDHFISDGIFLGQ